VGYVLEGSVLWDRTGEGRGRVRITPQLIRVADDTHLWSERYDRVVEDIFEVQSDIAERVIEQLEVTLLEPEQRVLQARPTDNLAAYNAYLRGLSYSLRIVPEEIEYAVEMSERAIDLDPDFALVHALLSMNHSNSYQRRHDFTPDRKARAKRAADRALELDPDLPEGHRALGQTYALLGRKDEAIREAERAEELLPISKDAIQGQYLLGDVAQIYSLVGEPDEALDRIEYLLSVPSALTAAQLRLHPNWDPLRDHPRFAEILDKYGGDDAPIQ
jgi:tetratricopeptide (TPR) repeat protein